MIKKLHFVLALLLGSALSIFAQEPAPQLQWASVLDGEGLEIGEGAVKTADNNVAILSKFNSKESMLNIDYLLLNTADGSTTLEKSLNGAPDTFETNGNCNMALTKVDAKTGHLLWSVHTNIGNFDGGGYVAATPDNGIVLLLKMRHTSRGAMYKDTLCQFVDKDGNETAVKWNLPTDYEYAPSVPVLVKISGEGKVVYAKYFDVKYGYWDVAGKQTKHTDNFDLGGVVADAQGNVYATGIYRTEINFGEKANFKTSRNGAAWDGDPQTKRGDLFVVKFDTKGEAVWGATTAGDTIACESPRGIAIDGDKLYVSGYMKGNGTAAVSFGDSKVVPSDRNSLFMTSLSTNDGSFLWAASLNGRNNAGCSSSNIKPMGMSFSEGNLYMYGSFQGDVLEGDAVVLTSDIKKLNSYVIKCDAKNGAFLGGIRVNNPENKNAILEIESVHAKGETVFATGYDLFGDSYIYVMDEKLSPESLQKFTVKKSNMGTSQCAAYVDDLVINVTRAKLTASLPGYDWTYKTVSQWACLFTCHSLEDFIKDEPEPVVGDIDLKWITSLDGKGLEIGEDIVKTFDKNVAILSKFNSKESMINTDYGFLDLATGEKTVEKSLNGAPDTFETNGNCNMALTKIDAKTGHLLWSVHTNIGNFDGGGYMAATPDNGIVLLLKMRHTSRGAMYKDTLCQFVDKSGKETAVKWELPTDYEYAPSVPVLVKINGEGLVEWTKRFDVKYGYWDVAGKETKHTDNFDLGGIVADAQGNVYATGIYRTEINFGEKANFKTSRNGVAWDGDPQTKRGDLFVVKFDTKGEAVWGATTSGDTIACESPRGIAIEGNKLYVSGYMKGNGTAAVSFGDNNVVPADRNSLFMTSLSTEDGSFLWAKTLNGRNNAGCSSSNIKPMGMSVANGNLYMYGSFQGDVLEGEEVVLTSDIKKLNGYIIKCDANDGAFLNSIRIENPDNKNAILEVESVNAKEDKIFATGYDLFGDSYIYVMDQNLSTESLQKFTVKKSNMGTSQCAAYVDDMIINVTRAQRTATFPGLDWTYNVVERWACLFTCHSISSFLTGIEETESVVENTSNIALKQGGIVVETAVPCEVRVYNVAGMMVYNAVVEGRADINLPRGLYIVNGKKVMIR